MIYEESCDTGVDLLADEIQICITEINYILAFIKIQNSYFKVV